MEKEALPFHKYLKNSIIFETRYETAHRRASALGFKNREYFSQVNLARFEEKPYKWQGVSLKYLWEILSRIKGIKDPDLIGYCKSV